jgi:hypothetical protein
MIVIRILALVSWVFAVLTLGIDLVAWMNEGAFASTSLGRHWFALHPGSLNLLQVLTERHLSATLWDPGIVTVLQWPAWAVFGGLAIVLTLVAWIGGRRRRRT